MTLEVEVPHYTYTAICLGYVNIASTKHVNEGSIVNWNV